MNLIFDLDDTLYEMTPFVRACHTIWECTLCPLIPVRRPPHL